MSRKLIHDVVIAGGGVMGMSVAFNLTKYIDPSKICVIERDPAYVRSASALSWASIRQQFSLAENIRLSQSSIKFIRSIDRYLGIDGEDPIDINYKHGSYLFLTRQETSHLLEENIAVQQAAGVKVRRYNREQLKAKYPYLNVSDIVLGSDCDEDEGWFDPWLLLSAYKNKIRKLGVKVVNARLTQFHTDKAVQVYEAANKSNYKIHYNKFINATGIHATFTNDMLNAVQPIENRFHLPVIPQRRQTFNIACKDGPQNVPLMCCPLKTVIRSEGPNYIVLYSAGELMHDEQVLEDFGNVDDSKFVNDIWENLAYRMPAFEAIKILGGWVGYYEYNTLDQNALIGQHPLLRDHYNINGFSGHGIQQAAAAGQCLAEIISGVTPHIDIAALSLQRVVDNKPYRERNIL